MFEQIELVPHPMIELETDGVEDAPGQSTGVPPDCELMNVENATVSVSRNAMIGDVAAVLTKTLSTTVMWA